MVETIILFPKLDDELNPHLLDKVDKKQYFTLIEDTQVIIGALLTLFCYGQGSQITNSLTTNAFHYDSDPTTGFHITSLREKVARRNMGIPINNNLETIILF